MDQLVTEFFFPDRRKGAMQWTAAEWGSFLTAAGAALVLLVKTCFPGMSESRCEQIRCLGCCSVTRKVKEEVEDNAKNTNSFNRNQSDA